MIFFIGIIAVLVMIAAMSGAPSHAFFPPVIILFVFVAFWVFVIKLLIGFGRWLITPAGDRSGELWSNRQTMSVRGTGVSPVQHRRDAGATTRLTCTDPRCGKTNVTGARFCAQCGRPLRSGERRETA